VHRTYELAPDTVKQIEETAARLGVGRNDLVRFCVRHALVEIEAGRLEVPTRPIRVHKRIVLPSLNPDAGRG